jgi:hypothetical protein
MHAFNITKTRLFDGLKCSAFVFRTAGLKLPIGVQTGGAAMAIPRADLEADHFDCYRTTGQLIRSFNAS